MYDMLKKEWDSIIGKADTIIILDACRYDYYIKFRNAGKFMSLGKTTQETIPRLFSGKYDHVYISGNPFINSKGVGPLSSETGYKPKEHFPNVVDVWDFGWDEELGTTPPWSVAEEAIKWQRKGYKTLIHYMQPHFPFISKIKLDIMHIRNERNEVLYGIKYGAVKWKFPDVEIVRKAYYYNLELVLKYALKTANGKTVITADHGDLLGEKGVFGHPSTVNDPKLLEILFSVPVEVIG